jgi:hypothetical protein
MITNGLSIPKGTQLTTQVCIAGSGPAGITLAYYLQKAGVEVILLEGSRDVGTGNQYYENTWNDKTLLYEGEATGQFSNNEPQFLVVPNNSPQQNGAWERERCYGGTSAHWGGQSRPYDPIDFEYVSQYYPGWPITREDLDPFYQEASGFCNLYGDYGTDGNNFDSAFWGQTLNDTVPNLPGFDTEMYQFLAQSDLNFATRIFDNGQTIDQTPVKVILNATLLNINHSNGSINNLTVGSMEGAPPIPPAYKGHSFTIKADKYVIALGAVANARQLLLAQINNDNIGRYFMGHALVAHYIDQKSPDPIIINGTYLTTSENNFMNGTSVPPSTYDGLSVNARFIPDADTVRNNKIGRCWFWAGGGGYYFGQAANPDSRITLTDTLDQVFGQQEINIDWEFCQADEDSYNTVTNLFNTTVGQTPLGKQSGASVTAIPWDQIKSRVVVNGHHLGTTRMSETAADGVVNTDLRSHDLDNLYVAGSSVWPSCGISNPTFTIITLSIRLADHLIKELAGGIK